LLRVVAQQHSQDLIVTPGRTIAASTISGKPYKAQSGDTVSKMAGRFLGANTKANRDLIIKANPSLQAAPDRIVVGQTYMIPTPASTTTDTRGTAPAAPAAVTARNASTPAIPLTTSVANATTPAPVVRTSSAASPGTWYTVKEHDTLWGIATRQCGSPDAIAAIQELNKASLKGGTKLHANMKLRLPARQVASAS
jgi:nucleoid-associated protein YgaU